MPAQVPITVDIGAMSFISPTAQTKLTRVGWASLGQAVLMDAGGHLDGARALLLLLEDRLGVHDSHRRALIHGVDAERASIRLKGEVRRREQISRVRSLNASQAPAPISPAVLTKLEEARKARMAAAGLRSTLPTGKGKGQAAKEQREKIRGHENAARQHQKAANDLQTGATEKHWADGAVSEAEALALGRGEVVDSVATEVLEWVRDEDGALVRDHSGQAGILKAERAVVRRLSTHNGFEFAYESGDLDEDGGDRLVSAERLYQVGNRYHGVFDLAEGRVTGEKREGGGGGYGPKDPQQHIIDAREELAKLRDGLPVRNALGERLSIRTHPLSLKTRRILDEICGRDRTPAATAQLLGMGHRTVKKHLRRGLFHVGENLDWW